jgi:molybdenum cofactor cytidylyltransferase
LAALSPESKAAVFVLGDQPEIEPRVIDALIATWRDTRLPVVVPRYLEGVSNPVLFDRSAFPELAAIVGDVGARAVVRAHKSAGDLAIVDVDLHAPADVDTEGDYRALLERLRSRDSVTTSGQGSDRNRK